MHFEQLFEAFMVKINDKNNFFSCFYENEYWQNVAVENVSICDAIVKIWNKRPQQIFFFHNLHSTTRRGLNLKFGLIPLKFLKKWKFPQ